MFKTKVIRTERIKGENGSLTGKIDIDKFSKAIEAELNNLKSENSHLIKILPVISGQYGWDSDGGYGFGYTDGVILIGKKDE